MGVITNDSPPPPQGVAQLLVQKLGGTKLAQKWQDRWIVVRDGELIYYATGTTVPDNTPSYEERGRLALKGKPVHNHDQSFRGIFAKAAYCVRIPTADKDMFLNCASKTDRDALKAALEKQGARVM